MDKYAQNTGPPVMYSGTENRVRSAPPLLGEHTREILAKELGLATEELDRLKREKVIDFWWINFNFVFTNLNVVINFIIIQIWDFFRKFKSPKKVNYLFSQNVNSNCE